MHNMIVVLIIMAEDSQPRKHQLLTICLTSTPDRTLGAPCSQSTALSFSIITVSGHYYWDSFFFPSWSTSLFFLFLLSTNAPAHMCIVHGSEHPSGSMQEQQCSTLSPLLSKSTAAVMVL